MTYKEQIRILDQALDVLGQADATAEQREFALDELWDLRAYIAALLAQTNDPT